MCYNNLIQRLACCHEYHRYSKTFEGETFAVYFYSIMNVLQVVSIFIITTKVFQ